MQIFCIVAHLVCLVLEDVAGYAERNKTGKMPTSKRKMNRKRWKQHVITGKRYNNPLGFNIYIDVIFLRWLLPIADNNVLPSP